MTGPTSPRGKREKGRNAVNAVARHYERRDFMAVRSPFEPGIDLAVLSANSHLAIEVKAIAHLYSLDSKDKRIIWDRAQECRRKGVGYLLVQVLGVNFDEARWWRVDGLEPSKTRNGLSLKVFDLGYERLDGRGPPREGEVFDAPPLNTTSRAESRAVGGHPNATRTPLTEGGAAILPASAARPAIEEE